MLISRDDEVMHGLMLAYRARWIKPSQHTCQLLTDLQNISDPQTDSGSFVHGKLQTLADADPIPSSY